MSFKVVGPVVQHLGFQGDAFQLKVVFPIYELDDVDPNYPDVEQAHRPAGMRAIVLDFRAEDLPAHSNEASILHFNVGRAVREHFGVEDPHGKAS